MTTKFDPFAVFIEAAESLGTLRSFDLIRELNDELGLAKITTNYPPTDIIEDSATSWRIRLAVSGFSREELSLKVDGNALVIIGDKAREEAAPKLKYIRHGIAERLFKVTYNLPRNAEVIGAEYEYGILTVKIETKPVEQTDNKVEIDWK